MVYCDACDFGQLHPLPTSAELAELYGSDRYFASSAQTGYQDYFGERAALERTFVRKLSSLLRLGQLGSLLDVGCGPGVLLEVARRMGIEEPCGVDLNPWAVRQARDRGLEVWEGEVDAVPTERRFEAVTMLDVLEHVTDPDRLLATVRSRLAPHGLLFLMTPNLGSWLERISGPRWVSYKVPEHVCYYTPRSVRAVLERNGYEVLSIRPARQYVSLRFLLERIGRLVPWGEAIATRAGVGPWGRLVLRVPNGSIDVLARRSG